MTFLERNFLDIRNLDLMARGDSWPHRLDPRVKVLTTMIFIITVVSMDKYSISQLIPFAVFPVSLLAASGLPPGYFLKKILLVSPFALMVGLFNPLLDQTILLHIGSLGISGGWISLVSIMLRFTLTVGAALILIGITSFNGICLALEKFRVPKVFVVQLLFLYRYIFVLLDEASRMSRARSLRSLDIKGPGIKTFGSMAGNLLLRATGRAERIHLAMLCRGFDGNIHTMNSSSLYLKDILFLLGWTVVFYLLRTYNFPELIGNGVLNFT